MERVRQCLSSIGLNPRDYGLHSLRAGGASAAASAGVADRLIMRHGGRKSTSSKDRYIQESLPQLLHLSKSLAV